jgi:hypothetical protein
MLTMNTDTFIASQAISKNWDTQFNGSTIRGVKEVLNSLR